MVVWLNNSSHDWENDIGSLTSTCKISYNETNKLTFRLLILYDAYIPVSIYNADREQVSILQ